ncbi:hypothetical protein IHN63_00260 [Deinococcus sp. 6YEL10]|uniref:dTMP kinase n=1 Tax=Deinococcus sp. 6YEL10 TaxID=2745870 RepID=UPI001E52D307|nr:hypothetical protein [Deinococcus sp. 6YEL10]MCD0159731.1 hypothetical protein [Deinococcus sp. 6YEL10]
MQDLNTIYFEGPDGTGKTSIIESLRPILTGAALPVMHVREPGGILYHTGNLDTPELLPSLRQTILQEKLRSVMKEGNYSRDPLVTALMMQAARVETANVIEEWCDAQGCGGVVLSDRSKLSTIVYQSLLAPADRRVPMDTLRQLLGMPSRLTRWSCFPRSHRRYVLVYGQLRAEDHDALAAGHRYSDVEAAYREACDHIPDAKRRDTIVLDFSGVERPPAETIALGLTALLGRDIREAAVARYGNQVEQAYREIKGAVSRLD